MSEKRAKAALKTYYKPCVTNCQCPACRTVESIIADDPDMVGLLRWAYEQLEYAGGGGEEAALGALIERLEKQVDLSDEPPGWEWADDGFQNPEQWDKPDCMP